MPEPRVEAADLCRSVYVAGVAEREVDHRAAEDIGDDVDLGGLAAPRSADGLRLRPFCPNGRSRAPSHWSHLGQPSPRIQPASDKAASMVRQKPRRDDRLKRSKTVV
jgi:hypothetical protein